MKSIQYIISVLALVCLWACQTSDSKIIFHPSHEPSRANVPFSDAVETENLFFLTGQIGKNHKTGELVSGGIEAETHQVIKILKLFYNIINCL